MPEPPVITIFVRHSRDCAHAGDENWKRCDCRKHLRWNYEGKQYRKSAKARTWAGAEEARRKLEDEFRSGEKVTENTKTRRHEGTDTATGAEYLTPAEVGKILKLSRRTVFRIFANMPGVIDLGRKETPHKRQFRLLRIPRAVLNSFLAEHRVN